VLTIHKDDSKYRIVGIDAGTSHLGCSLIEMDLITGEVFLIDSYTIVISPRELRRYALMEENHGTRYARLHAMCVHLEHQFQTFQPHTIICESPFLGKFANAFAALTECLLFIKNVVHAYNPYMTLEKVDPKSAKLAVDSPANSKDKTLVQLAITKLDWLNVPPHIDIMRLDEHSTDSIAVACFKVAQIKEWINRS